MPQRPSDSPLDYRNAAQSAVMSALRGWDAAPSPAERNKLAREMTHQPFRDVTEPYVEFAKGVGRDLAPLMRASPSVAARGGQRPAVGFDEGMRAASYFSDAAEVQMSVSELLDAWDRGEMGDPWAYAGAIGGTAGVLTGAPIGRGVRAVRRMAGAPRRMMSKAPGGLNRLDMPYMVEMHHGSPAGDVGPKTEKMRERLGTRSGGQGAQWEVVNDFPERSPFEADDYLYHITSAPNAQKIIDEGLIPGKPSTAGRGGGYEAHSRGRTFLTDAQGVNFWRDRIEQHLFDQFDDPPEVVVMRIRRDAVDAGTLLDDALGSTDSRAPAYVVEGAIGAKRRDKMPAPRNASAEAPINRLEGPR